MIIDLYLSASHFAIGETNTPNQHGKREATLGEISRDRNQVAAANTVGSPNQAPRHGDCDRLVSQDLP